MDLHLIEEALNQIETDPFDQFRKSRLMDLMQSSKNQILTACFNNREILLSLLGKLYPCDFELQVSDVYFKVPDEWLPYAQKHLDYEQSLAYQSTIKRCNKILKKITSNESDSEDSCSSKTDLSAKITKYRSRMSTAESALESLPDDCEVFSIHNMNQESLLFDLRFGWGMSCDSFFYALRHFADKLSYKTYWFVFIDRNTKHSEVSLFHTERNVFGDYYDIFNYVLSPSLDEFKKFIASKGDSLEIDFKGGVWIPGYGISEDPSDDCLEPLRKSILKANDQKERLLSQDEFVSFTSLSPEYYTKYVNDYYKKYAKPNDYSERLLSKDEFISLTSLSTSYYIEYVNTYFKKYY